MAAILPPGKVTFYNSNNVPLVLGTVDFYEPGTTTRKTTYQDIGLTIPNANPVVLDTNGQAVLWGSGAYRQVVKDSSGNLIWDQITSALDGTGLAASGANADITALLGLTSPIPGSDTPVKSASTTSPPSTPADGDRYIVPTGASGAWSGQATKIAQWNATKAGWYFSTPAQGTTIYVQDTNAWNTFNGAAWAASTELRASWFSTVLLADASAVAIGATILLDSNFTLSSNTTLTAKWKGAGGIITRGTYTLSGNFWAPPGMQMFDATGTGAITNSNPDCWVSWFGAFPSSSTGTATDCTKPIQAAINSCANGGTVKFGSGVYGYTATAGTTAITVPTYRTLQGSGKGITTLYCLADNVGLFVQASSSSGYIKIKDMTLWGYADRTASLRGPSARLINLYYLDYIEVSGVEAKYSQDMSMGCVGTEVRVSGCSVLNSLRDGINVTGSQRIFISQNRIEGCGDDAISAHLSSTTVGLFDESVEITDNIIRKSYGIKSLGSRNAVISGNSLRFYYGYGVYLSATSTEGVGAKFNIQVANNDFSDGLNSSRIGGGSQNQVIGLGLTQSLGSGTTTWNVNVGQYDSINTTIQKPEPYINYSNGATGTYPIPPNGQIVIANNTARQTISTTTQLPIAKFSDAGFGTLWTNTGSQDPVLTSLLREMDFVQSTSSGFDVMGLTISFNQCEGLRLPVNLNGINTMEGCLHIGNRYRRMASGLTLIATSAAHIDFVSRDNLFDIDTYVENADHSISTGQWANTSSTGDSLGIRLSNIYGVKSINDSFANVRKDVSLSTSTIYLENPRYFYSWSSDGSTQAGIGAFNTANSGLHFWRDSVPTSGTYGKFNTTPDSAFITNATAQPSTGYFHKGQVVINSNPTLATGKITTSWTRITSGNGNVANTDWVAQVVPNS